MSYEITLTPKHLGLTTVITGTLLLSYLLIRTPDEPAPQQQLCKPLQDLPKPTQQALVYSAINDLSPRELINLVPKEKRTVLFKRWMEELTLTEKLALFKPMMEEGLVKTLSQLERGMTPSIPKIAYEPREPMLPSYSAAQHVLTLLEGN